MSVGLGVFFLAMSLNKRDWIGHPDLLAQRFERWLPTASPYARAYLEGIAIPGAPEFARLVPLGEFLAALAMFSGTFTNVAAGVALLMVLKFPFRGERLLVAGLSPGRNRVSADRGAARPGGFRWQPALRHPLTARALPGPRSQRALSVRANSETVIEIKREWTVPCAVA